MPVLGVDISAPVATCSCGLTMPQSCDPKEYEAITTTGKCISCQFDAWLDSLNDEPLDDGSTTPLNDTFPPEDD